MQFYKGLKNTSKKGEKMSNAQTHICNLIADIKRLMTKAVEEEPDKAERLKKGFYAAVRKEIQILNLHFEKTMLFEETMERVRKQVATNNEKRQEEIEKQFAEKGKENLKVVRDQ